MRRLLSILLLLFMYLLSGSHAFTQDKLKIIGTIFDEKGELENAKIKIELDSILQGAYRSDNGGRFSFELKFNRNYVATFFGDGYTPKKIMINTNLPEKKDPDQVQLVSMKMELMKQIGNYADTEILGEVKYSRITKEFTYETKYDQNALLNIQVVGIDYYLSDRREELMEEGELDIELLDEQIEIVEEDQQSRQEDFHDYIISQREQFLDEKADSLNLKEIDKQKNEIISDTVINQYTHHRMDITEIIINDKNILRVYHRVKHYWGGVFYFRNYRPITGTLFRLETSIDLNNKQVEHIAN